MTVEAVFRRKKDSLLNRELDKTDTFYNVRSNKMEHIKVTMNTVLEHLYHVREGFKGPDIAFKTFPGGFSRKKNAHILPVGRD